MRHPFSLDSAGYFLQQGRRIFPVGVNYWPASAGVELWVRWPQEEILRDLDLVASLGLNTVRFFLRWQEFEPRPGEYDPVMFERLRWLLGQFRSRKLLAHPSLFVGWMSGGMFWPQWRQGRNVFADPYMQERAAAFARHCARQMHEFADCILAMDQGNELCCIPDSSQAPPEEVVRWCGKVNDAIREVWPEVLLISGNENNQVINDTGWRLGQQPGCDLYSMHAYPVPGWHNVAIDGLCDPLTQSLLPLYTQCARAFGPVMVQEFATILTCDRTRCESYLKAILPACWQAGANGFLWWCLHDVTSHEAPYNEFGFEARLGLVDSSGKVKPAVEYFVEFARTLAQRPAPHNAGESIGLLWPENYYPRGPLYNGVNSPENTSRGLIMANYFLRTLGHETEIIRGELPIPAHLKTLVIAGCSPTIGQTRKLIDWVRQGGKLLWHGVDPGGFGPDYATLLGAQSADYRAILPEEIELFGQSWPLGLYLRNRALEVVPTSAHVIASVRERPVVLRHDLGSGKVVYSIPQIEQMVATFSGDRAQRDRWSAWYQGMLRLLD